MLTNATKIRFLRLAKPLSLTFAVLLYALCVCDVRAETPVPTQQEFDAAFATMLENPADVNATMAYANMAAAMQNYEAAIPALERILFFNPDLADVKLEIGVMYYKLGSHDAARTYFTNAMAPGASKEVVDKASSYLAAMGG